jgi:hypothetical protein
MDDQQDMRQRGDVDLERSDFRLEDEIGTQKSEKPSHKGTKVTKNSYLLKHSWCPLCLCGKAVVGFAGGVLQREMSRMEM